MLPTYRFHVHNNIPCLKIECHLVPFTLKISLQFFLYATFLALFPPISLHNSSQAIFYICPFSKTVCSTLLYTETRHVACMLSYYSMVGEVMTVIMKY